MTIIMTLRSIQNQSLKDFEIIIIDNGSLEKKVIEILMRWKMIIELCYWDIKKEKIHH